jgi:hypothetical protein
LDYTSVPGVVPVEINARQSEAISNTNGSSRNPWNARTQQPLSTYLKDAPPTPGKIVPATPQEISVHTTPPVETTTPDIHSISRGGDTPSSMAVERATEPSLRSYSPTSSIRASSDADYGESPPSLNFSSPIRPPTASTEPLGQQQPNYPPRTKSPMTESVSTLVATDSPQKPPLDSECSGSRENGSGEEYIVVSSTTSEVALAASSGIGSSMLDLSESSSKNKGVINSGSSSPAIVSGKALLGKGKIDAKAQDEFIAFMLGKK